MIKIKGLGFDWDVGNREKCRKHGLDLLEIEAFFQQNPVYITPDIDHSQMEKRYLAAGRSSTERLMLVVFTFREGAGGILIRPISARYMHRKEARKYEDETSKIEK
ncbi:MAG: hypothetical protein COW89_03075 [Nitrospinae bacterium CG22_combo_CG10-13_8_21_14_all_47_10]|nr:MAG: hypothetical protein COW89_03075 [Nitrospinae bacterium CG22_combo_CG10-13_8_21_14_all_47_10]